MDNMRGTAILLKTKTECISNTQFFQDTIYTNEITETVAGIIKISG